MQDKLLQRLLLLLLVVVLSACVNRSIYGYVKSGASSEQFYEDFRLCEFQNVIFKGRLFLQRREECMLEEGWKLSTDPRAFRPSDYTRPDGRLFPHPGEILPLP